LFFTPKNFFFHFYPKFYSASLFHNFLPISIPLLCIEVKKVFLQFWCHDHHLDRLSQLVFITGKHHCLSFFVYFVLQNLVEYIFMRNSCEI
jgi:hypothetical protein